MEHNRWFRLFLSLASAAVLLLGTVTTGVQATGPAGGNEGKWEKVSPDLLSMLAANPGKSANVIVEMKDAGRSPGAEKPEQKAKGKLDKQGGKRTQALGIIGGASGNVNLGRLAALSQDPEIRYISYDAPLALHGTPYTGDMVDFSKPVNANDAWAKGVTGAGVTVAVIDSGIQTLPSGIEQGRIMGSVDLVTGTNPNADTGGHGTHIAGIIAGSNTSDAWNGIAPKANVVSVKVTDDQGIALKSTVIKGIQWTVQNRATYGIRVLNLSLGSRAFTSYKKDPLAAAVEVAWHAGIVVVASAGNQGPTAGTIGSPGYDPYVITVGAVDMNGTSSRTDDLVASFSSRGPTIDGLPKPDVAAPGRKIVSSRVPNSYLEKLFPDRWVGAYLRLSGTSQAAAVVSGVAALIISATPGVTPDQVKQQIRASALPISGYDGSAAGAGYVNALTATNKSSGSNSKQAARPADTFATTVLPLIKGKTTLSWKDLKYNGGVDSRGVPWSNVSWDNVSWDNVTWDNVAWDNVAWDNIAWDNLAWDNVTWDNVSWDNTSWDNTSWDNTSWDNTSWDNAAWD